MSKIIMHVDMDAFFTSCEEQQDPCLKGKPVVVGADPKHGRGVVATCSYEARKYGLHSAMPISRAYKLCPQATYLKGNFQLYYEYSKKIMEILRACSSKFQQMGLDEAYLEATNSPKKFAYKIKNEIKQKTGLTASIGIGNNKLIAKIASDFQKPDGLTLVPPENNKNFLSPLPIRKLHGVGRKTEPKLAKLGVNTIGDLAKYNQEKLTKMFGIFGIYLHNAANGMGSDYISEDYERVSLGKERTFFEDCTDREKIYSTISSIAAQIIRRTEQKYFFKTISLKVRLSNFTTFTRAKTFKFPCTSKDILVRTSKQLLDEFLGNKIRLIGIRISHLEELKSQRSLKQYGI
jgi:DNA polymerase IV (archaeal DinB-like DNA polymerase)